MEQNNKEMWSMEEKVYNTMKNVGIVNIIFGIVSILFGIAVGVVSIVSGVMLLKRKSDITF